MFDFFGIKELAEIVKKRREMEWKFYKLFLEQSREDEKFLKRLLTSKSRVAYLAPTPKK